LKEERDNENDERETGRQTDRQIDKDKNRERMTNESQEVGTNSIYGLNWSILNCFGPNWH